MDSRVLGEASWFSTVWDWCSLLGDATGVNPLLGELPGVEGRACAGGELGVDGRRNGDARGELKDSGEGRNGALLEGF